MDMLAVLYLAMILLLVQAPFMLYLIIANPALKRSGKKRNALIFVWVSVTVVIAGVLLSMSPELRTIIDGLIEITALPPA